MKKFFSIFAAVALVFAMASCEEPVEEPNNNGGGNNTEQPGGNEGGENNGGENNGGDQGETPAPADVACLNGSDYYLISLDGTTYNRISSKVVGDYRTDDYNSHLWIWENTYTAGTCTGPNFFGEIEGWISLNVGTVGWSGAGFCCYNAEALAKLANITAAPADYVLHIALKSQDAATHELVLYSDGGGEAKVQIDVNGTYGYARDGEWHEIEIPMTHFTNQGLLWTPNLGAGAVPGDNVATAPTGGHNVMAVLSGASGSLNLDACFIYKPAK